MKDANLSFILCFVENEIHPSQRIFHLFRLNTFAWINNFTMRKIFLFILLLVSSLAGFAQGTPSGFDLSNYGVRIDADKRLIVVMAALEMAQTKNETGQIVKLINTPLSARGAKFREQLLLDNASLPNNLRVKITAFVAQYKKQRPKATDAEIVSPFISMAYTLAPVPDLADPAVTADLPGSLLDVLDFAPLAREFYRRSGISAKLEDYAKLYRSESDGVLRNSARDMVSDLLDYLHTRPELYYVEKIKTETKKANSKTATLQKIESINRERKFNIVPEMLSPIGNVNFLNIKDDYFVVLPPDKDLSFSEARRAFLQFVVDPLILKNSKDILLIKEPIKALLDERRKTDPSISPDVYLTVSRSLIAAIDARQKEYLKGAIATDQARQKIGSVKTDGDRLAVSSELERYKRTIADETALSLSEDYEKGAVLSFYFADQLEGIEDSGFDIASSMREMIAAFEVAKESGRLAQNTDARKRAIAARTDRKSNTNTAMSTENPITIRLVEIQKVIAAKNYPAATTALKELLAENPAEPRIYYNIGRVASLSAEGEEDSEIQSQRLLDAKVAYTNVIKTKTSSTDPVLLSLTYVALARIFEFSNDNAYAVKLYDEAIKIGDVSGGGFREALSGKQNLIKKP